MMYGIFKRLMTSGMLLAVTTMMSAAEKGSMIGYWNFDEGTGNQVRDVTGNGHDGTIMNNMRGIKWVDGKKGKALHFATTTSTDKDKTGSILLKKFPQNFPNGFTIMCWIKLNEDVDLKKAFGYILCFSPGSFRPGIVFLYCRGYLSFCSGDDKNPWSVSFVIPEIKGKWAHVAAVCDGKQAWFYLNGMPVAQSKPGQECKFVGRKNQISCFLGSGHGKQCGFSGIMDELKVYDFALPASEVVKEAKLDF